MRQHGYYAYQPQSNPPPNSPAPPAYDPSAALLQHLGTGADGRNSFGIQQQFPSPLSPSLQNGGGNTNKNGTGRGGGGGGSTDDANISLGVLAPSSPSYPNNASMAFMGTNSEQHQQQHVDSSRMAGGGSLIAPPSPSVQYITTHPPSPVISAYSGVYSNLYTTSSPNPYSPSMRDVASSPGERVSWPER